MEYGRRKQTTTGDPLPGEHRQQPVLLLVSKHLDDVLAETQRKAVFIRARPKDWSSESLCEAGASPSEEAKV